MSEAGDAPGASQAPVDSDEAGEQLHYVQAAMAAESDDERRLALIEGLLRYGHRFGYTLHYLADQAGPGTPFQALADEMVGLLIEWLGGATLTDRADEAERRARAAAMTLDEAGPEGPFARLAARAVLALPADHALRDVAAARAALEASLERRRADGDVDGQLLASHDLLEFALLDGDAALALIEQGEAVADRAEEPAIARNFRLEAMKHYFGRAIERRDAGDGEGQRRWQGRAAALLDRITAADGRDPSTRARDLLAVALNLEVAEQLTEAAETYAAVVATPELDEGSRGLAAIHEARLRLQAGQYRRVVEVLEPIVAGLEERYLTAVEAEAIEDWGERLARATTALAFGQARLGQWGAALGTIERGKSLRLRYAAALRASPEGRRLLELEADLYALARGAPVAGAAGPARAADWVGETLSRQSALLEEYRRQRPRLPADLLASPSVAALAAPLGRDEAVAVLGISYDGLLIAVVFPGDRDAPGAVRLDPDWTFSELGQTFADDGRGWLYALAAPELGLDPRAALDKVLSGADAAVGRPLADLLRGRGVRRVTIVPHRWLHLVPFWALPGLADYEVVVVPTATMAAATHRTARLSGRRALVVANSTGDLRVSPAEADAVADRLGALGFAVRQLRGAAATEEAVAGALDDAPLLHFCGHGRTNLLAPTRSALLVQPDRTRFPGPDPLGELAEQVGAWRQTGEEERYADLPGLGRLYEERDAEIDTLERRLEHGARGTLWARYRGGRLTHLAELWSAGDIMVQDGLRGCALAVLSACESGGGGMSVDVDEHAGLPAALQMAGVASLVCTLWPVSDGLAALWVDLFYEALGEAGPRADLFALVRRLGARLRAMERAEAAGLVGRLRARTGDPVARFYLEKVGRDLAAGAERPFAHPYDWAAFYVTGACELALEEVSDGRPA